MFKLLSDWINKILKQREREEGGTGRDKAEFYQENNEY